MVCKLAQVPPEIWMTLSVDAKKWLLNERKRQQQEDDKLKKSSSGKDTIKESEKERNSSSNMPSQYAKVKNTMKGRKKFKIVQSTIMGLLMNFLKKQSILQTSINLNRKQILTFGLQNITYIQVSV